MNYDTWKLASPPEGSVLEMDGEDEERILLDILWETFRPYVLRFPEEAFRTWGQDELFSDDAIVEALSNYHRKELDRRWTEEHSDPLDDGDAAYEARREREMEDR